MKSTINMWLGLSLSYCSYPLQTVRKLLCSLQLTVGLLYLKTGLFLTCLSLCPASISSVVQKEKWPACGEGASAESRVQVEQDPLLYHHDRLQPQLLLCRKGCLAQWTEGSAAKEHYTSQVPHTWTKRLSWLALCADKHLYCAYFRFRALGHGAFGEVYEGQVLGISSDTSPMHVAIKVSLLPVAHENKLHLNARW